MQFLKNTFSFCMFLGFLVAFSGSTSHSLCWAESSQPSKPNVIFILSDDQGWSDYSFLQHPHIKTPNIDQLARESLVYTRGYVPDSLCRPSLASIISGLYPHQHRIVGNDPPLPKELLGKTSRPYTDPSYMKIREQYIAHIDRVDTLPKILKQHGYVSLQTGKWWEGNFARGGFDEGMTHGDMLRGGRHGDDGLKIGRDGMKPIDTFLNQRSDDKKPFFLWYAPMMPHTPHDPPERLLVKYRDAAPSLAIAKYWAMCEWFDETIGDLRGLLRKHSHDSNTIIVYVCDNGWINDPKESRYAPRSKRSPNEGGIRTPIMIHYPKHVPAALDDINLASSIDLVPTVLNLLDLPVPTNLHGIPLTNREMAKSRRVIQGEIFEHDVIDLDDPKLSLNYRWIIHDHKKLIVPNRDRFPKEPIELYDLMNDPAEQHNLADSQAEVVRSLQKEIEEHP